MFHEPSSLSGQLDWMLQSSQVSDTALVEVLVENDYASIYRLALYFSGDALTAQKTARETIAWVVVNRHLYWGEFPLKTWILSYTLKICRQAFALDDEENRLDVLASVSIPTQLSRLSKSSSP